MQSVVSEAGGVLKNANGLIKKSKQANHIAQDAIEEVKSRHAKTELDQKESSQLINKAKISDQKAKVAQEKYDDLRSWLTHMLKNILQSSSDVSTIYLKSPLIHPVFQYPCYSRSTL